MDDLIVPEPLARGGVERDERVGKEIRAVAIAAAEIGRRRLGRDIDDAALLIERRAGPVRRAAAR